MPVEKYEQMAGMKLCFDFLSEKYLKLAGTDNYYKSGFERFLLRQAAKQTKNNSSNPTVVASHITNGDPATEAAGDDIRPFGNSEEIAVLAQQWIDKVGAWGFIPDRSIVHKRFLADK